MYYGPNDKLSYKVHFIGIYYGFQTNFCKSFKNKLKKYVTRVAEKLHKEKEKNSK